MKTLMNSKTFWKAVIVAITGVLTVALTELDLVGMVAVVSAIADVALRLVTNEEIKSIM
jgi:uncharacterized membrane protein